MGYVALRRLKWGDTHIEAGDPVPEDDPDRNYHLMVRSGQIGGLPSKKPATKSGTSPADSSRSAAKKPATKSGAAD